jgi:hypothetical protein
MDIVQAQTTKEKRPRKIYRYQQELPGEVQEELRERGIRIFADVILPM